MVAEAAAAAVVVATAAAETWHARRARRLAPLAFGPRRRPAGWARLAPAARVVALAGIAWGLVTLLWAQPKIHQAGTIPPSEYRHLVLVLDVSPSMRLKDAGPNGEQTRVQRAADLLDSLFDRLAVERHKVTIVACYNGAKPVVEDTKDTEVVRNVFDDLPMQYAFRAGKTDLFSGLAEAARIARPWPPRSASLVLFSDGDTVPASGMPRMPPSVASVLVIGVGDPHAGKFIDGHQSRQDASMLRQIAARLRGVYHNGNRQHVSTSAIHEMSSIQGRSKVARWTRREYALAACGGGAAVYALLPVLLHLVGTAWRPGVGATRAFRTATRVGAGLEKRFISN